MTPDCCPFCYSVRVDVWDEGSPSVRCYRCGAVGPEAASEEQAVMWWNETLRLPPGRQRVLQRKRYTARRAYCCKVTARRDAERKAEYNKALKKIEEQERADRRWAAERARWLRRPIEEDADATT